MTEPRPAGSDEAARDAFGAYERLLDRLSTLAQTLGTARDLRSVFAALRRFATASTPSNGLFASLLEPETQLRRCVYAWTEDEEIDVAVLPPLPMTNSPNSRSVATGQIIVTDDLQSLIADQPRVDLGFDVDPRPPRSSIAVPMAVMGRIIGGFEVQSAELAAYTQEHVVAMRMAANLAAIATENVRLLEQEREQRRAAEASEGRLRDSAAQARFLAEAGRLLGSSLDYETTLTNVANLAVTYLADWCFVDLVEADGSFRRLAVAHEDPAKAELARDLQRLYLPLPDVPHGVSKVARTGQSELAQEMPDSTLVAVARDERHLQLLREVAANSYICVALRTRDRTIGALTFLVAGSGRCYGPADLRLAEDLADRAALAVDNALLYASERTSRAEAEAALHVRDEFLSIASHELRTPVTSLLAYVQVLQRRAARDPRASPRDVRALQVIGEQSERLSRLIAALLDVSRIELGHFRIECHKVDLPALARRVVEQVQPTTERHTLAYTGPDSSLIIQADDMRIEQVILNLLQNSIKYSPDGGHIEVRVEQAGDEAIISVMDQGMGIPAEARSQLFQRFYRAANVDGSHISGLGIGLFVVKEIVCRHGGRIEVDSTEGEGSTFTVRLPIDGDGPTG